MPPSSLVGPISRRLLRTPPSFSRWRPSTMTRFRWIVHPSTTTRSIHHRNFHRPSSSTSFTDTNVTDETIDNIDASPPIHDVIIIGGGPTGLLLSNLLSSYGIHSHLLIDKRPVDELLKHPQAHFINVRSMEILKAEVPRVYEGVLNEMPDVDEWDGFHFGGSVMMLENNTNTTDNQNDNDNDNSMAAMGGRRLGRVIHPVRAPLKVGQPGDAFLVPKMDGEANGIDTVSVDDSSKSTNQGGDDAQYVSSCRPAHLAQNKFVNLLLQEARRHSNENNDMDDDDREDDDDCNGKKAGNQQHLLYGEEVLQISGHTGNNDNNWPITVQTSKGRIYHTRYLIAADGVQSFVRKHCNIPMMGDACMQNLINVHFRTNAKLSELLMQRDQQAMLHFVYNSQLVGAFVCHDGREGEWVLQIPFFPPYQTMDDFSANEVKGMIWAGLVGTGRRENSATDYDLEILSIRPWTMSSLVAQRYLNESSNVILAGDAAHAFPPAGGFGMNTGLQDAHNIAWRLALLLSREKYNSNPTTVSFSNKTLAKYDAERRPVATQNAALSVRNYQRTLRIAKACYLDAQHPQLLISMLNSPPMNMLPLSGRQDMFSRLVRVAMMPLGSLTSSRNSNFHADHIEKNVRSILESGGSLPLVFPRYELGFSYGPNDSLEDRVADKNESGGDTAGYFPRLEVGHRMPRVMVEVLDLKRQLGGSSNDSADSNPDRTISMNLMDISSQWRRASSHEPPLFTLFAIGPSLTGSTSLIGAAEEYVTKKWNVPLQLINVLPANHVIPDHQSSSGSNAPFEKIEPTLCNPIHAVDTQHTLLGLLHDEKAKQNSTEREMNDAIIMVRPDGHIANISWINTTEDVSTVSVQIQQVIEQGLQNALGNMNMSDLPGD